MALVVSVIVPTYNRLAQLRRMLEAIGRQDLPLAKFEVVVIADGCTDGTDPYLQSLAGPLAVRAFAQENKGPAAARNRGIAEARSDLVVFLDDDVVPATDFLSEHLRTHAGRKGIAVIGPLLTPGDYHLSAWNAWEQAMLEKQYTALAEGKWTPTARQFFTGNASVARSHLIDVGGFDERYRRAEDVELGYRLAKRGIEFVFNPRARGYHYANRSFQSWLDIASAYGRHDAVFFRDGEQRRWQTVKEEFAGRHKLNQILVRGCLDRPRFSRLVSGMLRGLSVACHASGLERGSRAALSGLFNLRYYQGVCDEIGGRKRFLAD